MLALVVCLFIGRNSGPFLGSGPRGLRLGRRLAKAARQHDEKLTANCGGGPNIYGNVKGQAVTFVVKTGAKQEYTATFTGELDQKATTITGVWTIEDGNGKREGQFTLRKHSGVTLLTSNRPVDDCGKLVGDTAR